VILNEGARRAPVVAAENAAPAVVVGDQFVWYDPASAVVVPVG
jgi:hypothetical protein